MNEALTTALTFPTLPLSILLAFVVIYWLLSAIGVLDIDSLESMLSADVGDVLEASAASETAPPSSSFAALLSRVGLSGVPLMVSLSILVFFAWAFTYYAHLFFLTGAPAPLRWTLGLAALAGCLAASVIATAIVLKPIRAVLARLQSPDIDAPSLIGKEGVVSSPTVDSQGGRADFDNGGAGLVLQVKAMENKSYARGAAVIIVSHDPQNHVYEVVSKESFYFHK